MGSFFMEIALYPRTAPPHYMAKGRLLQRLFRKKDALRQLHLSAVEA
jgi:hypothetical protein